MNRSHLTETVNILSKKIHKFPRFIRKPYHSKARRVSLNSSFAEDSISTCDLHSNAEFEGISVMETEEIVSTNSNNSKSQLPFTTISYVSPVSRKSYTFSCFSEKDFHIPEECKGKIVELSCDDDCMTDDEQIKGAIRKLHSALQDSVTKRKQQENSNGEKANDA